MRIYIFLIISVLFFTEKTTAQYYNSGMSFLTNSRSVSSYGIAQQGVTIRNSIEGMTYNPANVVFQKDLQISYFYDPFYFIFPGTTYRYFASSYSLSENVFVGIDYYNSSSTYTLTTEFDPAGYEEHSYERSVSFSLAQKISSEFNYGVQLRYSWLSFPSSVDANSITISTGVNYEPEYFGKRVLVGLSFMNFGFPIEYHTFQSLSYAMQKDAPPSVIYLGTEINTIQEDFAAVNVNIQTSKLIAKYSESSYEPQSAFQSLFNDWTDAPRDMILSSGVSVLWKPIELGNKWTLEQQWYVGHRNLGPKVGNNVALFHGLQIGIGQGNMVFTVGYAGETYSSSDFNRYFQFTFPKEVFQFDVKIKNLPNYVVGENSEVGNTNASIEKIIFNVGISTVNRIGLNSITNNWDVFWTPVTITGRFENSDQYRLSANFYFSDRSALVTSFSYSRIPYAVIITPNISFYKARIEDLQISSLYRYHPLTIFAPLFIESGIGIQRMNPIESSSPKYFYNSLFHAGLGMQFLLFDSFYITPTFGASSILREINGVSKRVGGHNQTELTLHIGYSIY